MRGYSMQRGWEVTLKDGTVLTEESTDWKNVPKSQIETLSLLYDGRRWDIAGKEAYIVKNTASMIPGIKVSFRVETRSIGYYEGGSKVFYNIDEATGRFKMYVEG